ncbi:MAG TPA: hypothetical protein VEC99_16760 [Clostridia bacterium]|nr:hypothetical protein [Clostridia bacterium]
MKQKLIAALQALFRPLAAKLFPEQFKERTAEEIVLVGSLNIATLKEHMVSVMQKRNKLDELTAQSTEAEVYATIGYQKAVRDFDKLWEVALNGKR